MSGKNRRNNQQRQQESDNSIAYVQCDGLVSVNCAKFSHKSLELQFISVKRFCRISAWNTLHTGSRHHYDLRIHLYLYGSVKSLLHS